MNRLAGEPSAYLRQHAQNPLDWQPFDDAAFAESVARDVPIFLSVGYAACHWCHVMAGESFEDPAVAAYLNERFVAIKVDREERPDVDDAYMAATQALSGQGGWPMSVFLTPDGKAFYAGTYFPPTPGSGRPSFLQVLKAVHEAWTQRRDEVERTAASLAEALAQPMWQVRTEAQSAVELGTGEPDAGQGPDWKTAAAAAVAAMSAAEDRIHGGFGQAPKFPPTPGLEFLLRQAASGAGDTSDQAFALAGRTLGAMVHSALFDQLGGGFARYSVTVDWSEPHYEKMLYDNAGLLQALVHWIRLAEGRPEVPGENSPEDKAPVSGGVEQLSVADAKDATSALIGWLMTELRLPGGAFASSLDADTVIDGVHHEGASYQWSEAEIQAAAQQTVAAEAAVGEGAAGDGQQAGELAAGVTAAMGIPGAAGRGGPLNPGRALSATEHIQWARIKPALLQARALRTMPARDDKVVACWNAMLMGALAEAGMVLEVPAYVAAAVELGEYLREVHWDGELSRVSHDGRSRGIKGLLEDYGACANAYLTLYAATGERRWFEFAGELVESLERDFIADGVVFNHSAGGVHGPLQGSRFADPFDNASISGVALLAGAFISWSAYTGSNRHRQIVENMLATVPELAQRAPRSVGGLLSAALAFAAGPLEVAVVGPAGAVRDSMVCQAWHSGSPGMVIAVWDGMGRPPVPLLEGRGLASSSSELAGGELPTLAHVCQDMVCARPVSTVADLAKLL
ncbi:thioredoxin domain-containing protein [Arthrobacter sp.]|uniref:thioredoxin domain-containing protein n=1 Tax=Arthrobacter sp. TaxID=1667 RepID=UPI0026DEAED8|nr:thioredoxin domain-containing protein [Arthrobacter sp.]MDO5752794.1 thioredoxin domain-containing protein [Arthrobacter sp.]